MTATFRPERAAGSRSLSMRAVVALAVLAAVAAPPFALHFGSPAAVLVDATVDTLVGQLVYRSGTYAIRLTEQPCPVAEFAAELEEVGVPPAWAYVAAQSGWSAVTGCCAPDTAGDILLRDPTTSPEQMATPAAGSREP